MYGTDEIETELKTVADVKRAVEDGVATSETTRARSIAAPLTRWIDKPILAVEVTVPADDYSREELVASFGEPLKLTARLISV
jgi:DNA-binding IclR family transcriptional regulator